MKKTVLLLFAALFSTISFAKDIKTLVVTTSPQMHCANCENRIKGNLRFEKGVKAIETDIEHQTVTIRYDAEKNTPAQLIQAFSKFGYTAREVKGEKEAKEQDKDAK